ncbi:MAG: alpha/beta hydrolase [Pseudomonadales bacterium]
MSADEHSMQSDGVAIRYVDIGEGAPVVFVHGLFGSAEMWMQTGVAPAAQFRTIALDCRGHGQSGKPHRADAYGMLMVVDLVNLLDRLNIEKAHFVGYSMGAEIVLKLATQYPDRVRSVVVGGSGWSGKPEAALYALLADSLDEGAGLGLALKSLNPETTDAEIASANEMLQGQDTQALAGVTRAMHELTDVSHGELSAIGAPVLALAGEQDPERPNLEKMRGVVSDFRMRVLEDRDHMSAVSDPQFKNAIHEFLAAQE